MFFQKAKRIKELEAWVDLYYKENQKDRMLRRESVKNLMYKLDYNKSEYEFREKRFIAAMLSAGKDEIVIDNKYIDAADNYRLRVTLNMIQLKEREEEDKE